MFPFSFYIKLGYIFYEKSRGAQAALEMPYLITKKNRENTVDTFHTLQETYFSETLAKPIFLGNSFCCGTISLRRKLVNLLLLQKRYIFSRILTNNRRLQYMEKVSLYIYSRLFVVPSMYMSISNFFG